MGPVSLPVLVYGRQDRPGVFDGGIALRKVSVIGAGGWGCALACVLCRNGHDVTLWSILEDEVLALRQNRVNQAKLPGVRLPEAIEITSDLSAACSGKDLLVFAVPSVFVRSTSKMAGKYVGDGQVIVNVAKGIEENTLYTMTDIISEEIPQADVAVLSGPSHAEEVGREIPTTVVAGAKSEVTARLIQDTFMNDVFRVYISSDMTGIELGGALKNIIALAAGVIDGLGLGDNTKAALMTRGIAEMARLGLAAGGKLQTFAGLSGIGDLIVTCTSRHSRNHNAGELIGRGYTMQQAMDEVKMVVEGVFSAKAAKKMAEKYGVSMPIVEEVNKVLFDGKTAKDAMNDLLTRERKEEFSQMDWE